MVRTAEIPQGNKREYDADKDTQRKHSRRTILGAGVAAATVGVAGGIVVIADRVVGDRSSRYSTGDVDVLEETSLEVDSGPSAGADEAMDVIASANLPKNNYSLRKWADPERYDGLTSEELTESMHLPLVPGEHDVEKLGLALVRNLEAIGNASLTENNIRKAIDMGYPVGEVDTHGDSRGGLRSYAIDNIINPMLRGMFDESYTDQALMLDDLRALLSRSADYYDRSLHDESYRKLANFRIGLVSADYLIKSRVSGLSIYARVSNPTKEEDERIIGIDAGVYTPDGGRYELLLKDTELGE